MSSKINYLCLCLLSCLLSTHSLYSQNKPLEDVSSVDQYFPMEQEQLLKEEIQQELKFEQDFKEKLEMLCEVYSPDMTILDFVNHLRKKFNMPVDIDEEGFEDEGISVIEPIGANYFGKFRTYGQILSLLEDRRDISFCPQYGTIWLTPLSRLDSETNHETRYHDISWCQFIPAKRTKYVEHFDHQRDGGGFFQMSNSTKNMGSSLIKIGAMVNQPGDQQASQQTGKVIESNEEYISADSLIDIIRSSEGSWFDSDSGTINEVRTENGHYLHITQTRKAQENIARLLQEFRYLVDASFRQDPQINKRHQIELNIEKLLNMKCDLKREEYTFNSLVQAMEEKFKVPFYIDLEALDDKGIVPDELFIGDIAMEGIINDKLTYRQCLTAALQKHDLTFSPMSGTINITTKSSSEHEKYQQLYVHDLNWLKLNSCIKPEKNEMYVSDLNKFIDSLSRVDGRWQAVDGEGGYMGYLVTKQGQYIFMRTTYQVHHQLYLAMLKLKLREEQKSKTTTSP